MPALTSLFSLDTSKRGLASNEDIGSPTADVSHVVVQCKEELLLTFHAKFELQETLLRNLQATVDDLTKSPRTRGTSLAFSGRSHDGFQPSSLHLSDGRKSLSAASSKQEDLYSSYRTRGQSTDSNNNSELNSIVNRANDALKELDHEASTLQPASKEEAAQEGVRWRRRRLNVTTKSSGVSCGRDLIPSLRYAVKRWHLMPLLHCLSLLVVMVDATVIAVETDQNARHGQDNGFRKKLEVVDYAVVCYYITELALRVLCERPWTRFLTGRERRWNIFDLSLTLMSVGDLALRDPAIRFRTLAILRLLRMLRILRLLRMLRIFRIMAFLKEFHKLVLCLACSVQTLFPAMVLMCFFIFCASILFTQLVASHLDENRGSVDAYVRHELEDSFGTVGSSMLSLYMAITAGKNWGDLYNLLDTIGPVQSFLFFVFLMTAIYGLTNVVTAVFVESAMRATQNYRELLVQEMLIKERVNVKHMKEIFSSMDLDSSGMITLDEMMKAMHDDSLQLQEYFEALGLSANDTITLFNLLDSDNSGEIDIDEFCEGCMRLGGNATNFDMNCMWHEQRRTNREILKFIQHACLGLHGLSKSHRAEAKDFSMVATRIQQMMEKSEASSYYGAAHTPPLQRGRTAESASTTFAGTEAIKETSNFAGVREYLQHSRGNSTSEQQDLNSEAHHFVTKDELTPCSNMMTGEPLERVTEIPTNATGCTASLPLSSPSVCAREHLSLGLSSCDGERYRESL